MMDKTTVNLEDYAHSVPFLFVPEGNKQGACMLHVPQAPIELIDQEFP